MDIKSILSKLHFRKAQPEERVGHTLAISWTLMLALSLGLVCAVGWAFFMGLMVGRGQNPQASIQHISGMKEAEPPISLEPEPVSTPLPQQTEAETASISNDGGGIIPQGKVAQEKTPPRQKPAPKIKPVQNPQKVSPAKTQVYDYTFQVAALRNLAEAKKTSATLNKSGLRSSVQKSGKVYLVVVALRGGSNEVAEMQRKMRSLKMGKAMQLSRKAVEKGRRK